MSQVGVITQARMTSTRLPGKVLMEAAGKTMLEHHLSRLLESDLRVFVATTTNDSDDPIVDAARRMSVPVFRGSENDVLARYAGAAEEFDLDTIVRVTSDCPLIDGELVKEGIGEFDRLGDKRAYVSNTIERTYPRGFDFGVFSAEMLREAHSRAVEQFEREHVTAYFYGGEVPRTTIVQLKRNMDASRFRLTLDTQVDLTLIRTLIEDYSAEKLGVEEIVHILESSHELASLNAHVQQKKMK